MKHEHKRYPRELWPILKAARRANRRDYQNGGATHKEFCGYPLHIKGKGCPPHIKPKGCWQYHTPVQPWGEDRGGR